MMNVQEIQMWMKPDGVYYQLASEGKPWGPYKSETQVKQSVRKRFNRLHENCVYIWHEYRPISGKI